MTSQQWVEIIERLGKDWGLITGAVVSLWLVLQFLEKRVVEKSVGKSALEKQKQEVEHLAKKIDDHRDLIDKKLEEMRKDNKEHYKAVEIQLKDNLKLILDVIKKN